MNVRALAMTDCLSRSQRRRHPRLELQRGPDRERTETGRLPYGIRPGSA